MIDHDASSPENFCYSFFQRHLYTSSIVSEENNPDLFCDIKRYFQFASPASTAVVMAPTATDEVEKEEDLVKAKPAEQMNRRVFKEGNWLCINIENHK